MSKLVLVLCAIAGASLGALAGSGKVARATGELARSEQLRDEVDHLRTRFADVQRDLAVAQTPAAATAARAKLFQLRVDLVAIEDELAVLAGRREF